MISNSTFASLLLLPLITIASMVGLGLFEQSALQHGEVEGEGMPATQREELTKTVHNMLLVNFDGEIEPNQIAHGALTGMADALEDPFTEVLLPIEARDQSERLQGSYSGIGVTITRNPDGTLTVQGVFPGGPASRAGIKLGDKLVSAEDLTKGTPVVPFKGLSMTDAQSHVKGEAGTQVRLGIERDGAQIFITATRGSVPIRSVAGTRLLPGSDRVGYTRIESFNQTTVEQFAEAVEQLRDAGMRALILDLRDNPGGVLDASVRIADMFIAEKGKTIVAIQSSKAKLERLEQLGIDADRESLGELLVSEDEVAELQLPTVVLMNERSASASEVLAGALQDHNLAFILGTRSYGKGVVQRPYMVPGYERYTVKITIASYYTPLGNNLRRTHDDGPGGITPDLEYPLSDAETRDMLSRFRVQQFELPERPEDIPNDRDRNAWLAKDPQIEAALALLRGEVVQVPVLAGARASVEPEEAPEESPEDAPEGE